MNAPTIGQVYAAFDESSHALFRRAMATSRGGVVRLVDLACALADESPDAFFASPFPRLTAPAESNGPPPMTNEPALRATLQWAYKIAAVQTTTVPCITPRILWSALLTGITPWRRPPEEVFERLGLILPRELLHVAPVATQSSTTPSGTTRRVASPGVAMVTQASNVVLAAETTGPLPSIEDVLSEWLAIQDPTAVDKRAETIARLARMVRAIEQGP